MVYGHFGHNTKFEGYFFKELKFLKLEFHDKLEFQKCGKSLIIS